MIDIRHAEALEMLSTLADASVDAVVSDPPSGIGFMHGVTKWDKHTHYEPKTNKGRDLMRFGSAILRPWEVGFSSFIADVFGECWRVLDPFVGSGTTALACVHEGFDFIGSEQSAEYVQIARARVDHADPAGAITRRADEDTPAPVAAHGQGRLF